MKIIGFHNWHDAAYSVLSNGLPKAHIELERYHRIKNVAADAVKEFLETEELDEDVKYFVFQKGSGNNRFASNSIKKLEGMIQNKKSKLIIIGHHQSHAANAFFTSDYKEALIITIDGGGFDNKDGSEYTRRKDEWEIDPEEEMTSFTIWMGKGNQIFPLKMIPAIRFNPGYYWYSVTKHIFGLGTWDDPRGDQAGTVMGMAALGNPERYLDHFKNFGDLQGGDAFPIDDQTLKDDVKKSDKNKFDIAAALQKETEDVLLSLITPYITKYNVRNLCLSGGVSLNCAFSGKIFDYLPGINIFCDPIPYDAGLTLGGSRYVYHHILEHPRIYNNSQNRTPYLGKKYGINEINKKLELARDEINFQSASEKEVVELMIRNSYVISLFGGASESGRRALGNRSIVADPRDIKMKDIINSKVKHRQWFRPFAPSILREDVGDWFVHDIDSPYMSFTLRFKEGMAEKVPAVVHFDGTARLQTVKYEDNEWYYSFIKLFKEKTGVPMILNTSFNDREPIVETPEHAINCFLKTSIDYLYFRDFNILVSRK